jgi:hypothetical protein
VQVFHGFSQKDKGKFAQISANLWQKRKCPNFCPKVRTKQVCSAVVVPFTDQMAIYAIG